MKNVNLFKRCKGVIKSVIYRSIGIPYSYAGVPRSILLHLEKLNPIVLIDVGAHDGNFTQSMAGYYEIAKAILIEPLPYKAENLRRLYRDRKYEIFECALSSSSGWIDLQVNGFDPTSSIFKIKRDLPELAQVDLGEPRTIPCQAMTLDTIAANTLPSDIDLIKIDVQGAEHLAIAGAKETLKRTKAVWTEVSFKPLYDGSSDFKEIYTLLIELGFNLVEIEPGFRAPDGELLQGDALFVNRRFHRHY